MTIEMLSFQLDGRKWINYIEFEMTQVPVAWSVYYLNDDNSTMVHATDVSGATISGTIWKGDPAIYNRYVFSLPWINTSRIEIQMDRTYEGEPTSTQAQVAYPIGVRNVDFGMRYDDFESLPPLVDHNVTTNSVLGHVERLQLDDWNAARAIDGNASSSWKCEPQAVSYAVVPFYLDVRDADGLPQLIDQIYLDPLYTGPTMSVYYSNDDTQPASFSVSRSRIELGHTGGVDIVPGVGANFDDDTKSVTLGPESQLDTSIPWSAGAIYLPNYSPTANDGEQKWVLTFTNDDGSVKVQMGYDPSVNKFRLFVNGSYLINLDPPYFDSGVKLALVAGFDGTTYSLWVADIDDLTTTPAQATADAPAVSTGSIIIGADYSNNEGAQGFIRDVWIRQEPYDAQVASAFTRGSSAMMDHLGPPDKARGDFNAIFGARLVQNFDAWVGPDAAWFEAKEWTPVHRDYKLRKGIIQVPPVSAKYLKLEFTDLVCQPYPLWDTTVIRRVREFPTWVHNWYSLCDGVMPPASVNYGAGLNEPLISPGRKQARDSRFRQLGVAQPTGATIVQDPTYHSDNDTIQHKKFFKTARHEYTIKDVPVTYQQAFFVGLNEVEVYRVRYQDPNDEPEYYETLGDLSHINSGATTMEIDTERQVAVATAAGQTLRSINMPSFSNFEVIQVASRAAEWESQLTDAQLSFLQYDHIEALDSTFFKAVDDVVGSGVGHVLECTPRSVATYDSVDIYNDGAETFDANYETVSDYSPTTADYGIRTVPHLIQYEVGTFAQFDYHTGDIGTYDDLGSMDTSYVVAVNNVRMTAVVRIFASKTNLGTYELRIYSNGVQVAVKSFTLPLRKWAEIELPYFTKNDSSDIDMQIEVVQVDSAVSEPFCVDMLGLFQNPLRWEFSNDGGSTWIDLKVGMNDPHSFLRFTAANKNLQVRVTALRAGAVLSSYLIVPWYLTSPEVVRMPIDYLSRPGISELDILRAPVHKPMFQMWDRPWPQRYSLDQAGRVPITGLGMQLPAVNS